MSTPPTPQGPFNPVPPQGQPHQYPQQYPPAQPGGYLHPGQLQQPAGAPQGSVYGSHPYGAPHQPYGAPQYSQFPGFGGGQPPKKPGFFATKAGKATIIGVAVVVLVAAIVGIALALTTKDPAPETNSNPSSIPPPTIATPSSKLPTAPKPSMSSSKPVTSASKYAPSGSYPELVIGQCYSLRTDAAGELTGYNKADCTDATQVTYIDAFNGTSATETSSDSCADGQFWIQSTTLGGSKKYSCLTPNLRAGACYSEANGVLALEACSDPKAEVKVISRLDGVNDSSRCETGGLGYAEPTKITYCLEKVN